MSRRSLEFVLIGAALLGGIVLGACHVTRPNADHCFYAEGDHSCAELDPSQGSILAEYIATGKMTQKGSGLVEGIGEDFIPTICDFSLTKRAYSIPDAESFSVARELLGFIWAIGQLVHP